jgi:hypothetical protein
VPVHLVPFQHGAAQIARLARALCYSSCFSAHQSHQPHAFAERPVDEDHDFIRRVVAPGKLAAFAPALTHLGRASGLPHRFLKVKLAEWLVSLALRARGFMRGPTVPSSRTLRAWRRPASPASHGGCAPCGLPACAANTSALVLSHTAPSCFPALSPGTATSPLVSLPGPDALCCGVPLSGACSRLESRGRPRISRRSSADSGILPARHRQGSPGPAARHRQGSPGRATVKGPPVLPRGGGRFRVLVPPRMITGSPLFRTA